MLKPDRIIATILGCGSSGGVPRIGNDWGICDPNEPRNRRRRCALLIEGWRDGEAEPTRVLIDTGVDLREQLLDAKMKLMEIRPEFKARNVNEGFSGGEKKRNEILQMAVLEPEFAVLDETDSGLDIDAIKVVAEGVNQMMSEKMGLILITHYQRLLNYIKPHFVHVLLDGRIVQSGDATFALQLEEKGYDWLQGAGK